VVVAVAAVAAVAAVVAEAGKSHTAEARPGDRSGPPGRSWTRRT
jgi:hypothetical protein